MQKNLFVTLIPLSIFYRIIIFLSTTVGMGSYAAVEDEFLSNKVSVLLMPVVVIEKIITTVEDDQTASGPSIGTQKLSEASNWSATTKNLIKKNDRSYLNVQGPEFLAKFSAPDSAVNAKANTRIFLWSKMLVAEDPDFDPLQYLDKISVHWHQVAGPTAQLEDIKTRSATVYLPAVTEPAKIELRCTLSNFSGKKSLLLIIHVFP